MFTQPKHIQSNLIGEFDFLKQFAQPARTFRPTAIGGVGIDIRKSVKTEFHRRYLCLIV